MEKNNMTAVEWLIEQLVELDKLLDGRRKSDDSTVMKLNPVKIFKQAKQMEKEQHANTWIDSKIFDTRGISKRKTFQEYYNETYGK